MSFLARSDPVGESQERQANLPGLKRAAEWRSAPGVRLPFSDSGGVWRDRNRRKGGDGHSPGARPLKRQTIHLGGLTA